MEYKTLFSDVKIPVLGLGTWLIGGDLEPDYSDDANAIRAIQKAIELGYTHLDTAEMYGNGHCEELIGEAIKGVDRKKLFITSKVRESKLKYEDVLKSVNESLNRLQTNYINLFLIHDPSPVIQIEETMAAFDYLVEKEFVKYIGVSNFKVDQLIEAQNFTKNKIVANQIEYSLLTRNIGKYSGNIDMESETIPYCQQNDIIIMAERPIERGLILKDHPVLDALEIKYQKTKAQIAMNWLISKKNIIAIPKSINEDHLKENLGSIGWELEDEDINILDNIKFDI